MHSRAVKDARKKIGKRNKSTIKRMRLKEKSKKRKVSEACFYFTWKFDLHSLHIHLLNEKSFNLSCMIQSSTLICVVET